MARFKAAHVQMFQQRGQWLSTSAEIQQRFQDRSLNAKFTLHLARQLTVFSEVSLVLNAFANGILTVFE